MKHTKLLFAVPVFIILLTEVVFSKSILKEAVFSPKRADIYFYINVASAHRFFKKNGINTADVVPLFQKGEIQRENQIFQKVYDNIQEMLIIGQTEKIEKDTGVLVFMSVKNHESYFPGATKNLKSQWAAGKKVYIYDEQRNLYLATIGNILVLGFKPNVIAYLKSRKSKKSKNTILLKKVIPNSRGKTGYLYVPISKYIKKMMQEALKKGARWGRGLRSNVFARAMLNLSSLEVAFTLKDRITLFCELESTNALDGERVLMVSHFMIVGTSMAITFADMLSRSLGKKSPQPGKRPGERPGKNMEKIQAVFGRIRTKQKKKGVLLSLALNEEETREFVKSIQHSIEVARKKRERLLQEKRIEALFRAVKSDDVQKVKKMLAAIGKKNVRNKNGETLLYHAAKLSTDDMVVLLIEQGFDINAPSTKERFTPLHIAAQRGKRDVVETLVTRGAALNALDRHRRTPFHLSLKANALEIARYLLEKGARIDSADNDSVTPLHSAVETGNVSIVTELISKGADVKMKSKKGITPLHLASGLGSMEMVALFIKSGADVNAQSNDGVAPLHRAAEEGHIEVVKALVEADADISKADSYGNTAIDRARMKGNYEISEFLEDALKK